MYSLLIALKYLSVLLDYTALYIADDVSLTTGLLLYVSLKVFLCVVFSKKKCTGSVACSFLSFQLTNF
jgi:hypothetical protein